MSLAFSQETRRGQPDSASLIITIVVLVSRTIFSFPEPTLSAGVTDDLDCIIKWFIVGRIILSGGCYCKPGLAKYVLPHAEVRGSPIAHISAISSPDAGLLDWDALIVDIVVSSGRVPFILEICASIGTSQYIGAVWFCIQRHDFVLSPCSYISE